MLSLSFALCCLVAFSEQLPQSPEQKSVDKSPNGHGKKVHRPLTFDKHGFFQLSVFEDLHFGEAEETLWGPEQDVYTVKVLNQVLDKETPDLVVLNGDLITGENTFLENATSYLTPLLQPLLARNLSWASTYGNHDYDRNVSGSTIMAEEHRLGPKNARTRSMVSDPNAGVSNYYLPVYAPDCKTCNCAPELILWFFDSRGGNYFQKGTPSSAIPQPKWVDVSVVNWFQKKRRHQPPLWQNDSESLAFVHIPTNASAALQTEHGQASIDAHRQPGINDDYVLAPQAQGWCPDGTFSADCEYGGQDLPFMKAITSTPGLMGVFSGHDHGDTWCYKWDHMVPGMKVAGHGLNLCFGQHSGYGGYGNWIRGARQIRVSRDVLKKSWEVDTWIRLEDGDAVGAVTLNSTYGHDVYPATPDTMTNMP